MLTEEPLVSVVIPAYNHGKYVVQAIESVIAQTYQNIELLIINDGSTDNTHEQIVGLLQICEQRFVRFEYDNSPNRGLVRRLNHALDWAKGSYFAALASDDAWLPEKTAKQVEGLEANPESQMSYGLAILIDENGELAEHQNDRLRYRGGMIFEDLFLFRFHPPVNYMYRRSVFDQVGRFKEEFVQEDLFMNLRIGEKFPIVFIDAQISYYRVFPSMEFKRDPVKLYDCNKRILDEFSSHPLYPKALNEYRVKRFWAFSGYAKHKSEALWLLPLIRRGETNGKIIKGIIKLLFYWKII